MEEILASIRRIIADDPPSTPSAAAAPARPADAASRPAAEPEAANNSQADIDAMLASLDAGPAAASEPADDVLELTEEMALPEPAADGAWHDEPDDDLEFAESPAGDDPRHEAEGGAFDPLAARPEDFVPRGFGPRDEVSFDEDEPAAPQPMLTRSTVTAVESAFNSLATTVLSNNARTLEDLVKEMLRPMLKSWLDDNLPTLVERIVRAEIERVSRGR